ILRGQVEKISSDALVDILGTLGYRLDSVIGATEGHEFTLTLDECLGLPKDIDPPTASYAINIVEDDSGELKADGMKIVGEYESWGGPFRVADGKVEVDPDADRVIADE